MNEPQAFAQTDAEWLASINRARDWFQGPLGSLMLAEERRLLCDELTRYFGGYLVHYGPHAELPPSTGQIQRGVRLGPPLPGVDIACEEGAWPLSEHAADVVLLQHGLDFCLSPHRLLREAARTVRPGGHLLLIGINPWSLWASVIISPGMPCARPAAFLRRGPAIGSTCWASRWRNGASGAIVRRLRRQPGNRAWLAWSAGATPGSLRAPASIYWWHASWSWGCARCARASANRAVSWCPCRWRKSAGEIPKFRHDR